jgi:hypothetical protein
MNFPQISSILEDFDFIHTNGVFYNGPLFEQIEERFSTKALKASSVGDISGIKNNSQEIWFSGNCILIDANGFSHKGFHKNTIIKVLKELLE